MRWTQRYGIVAIAIVVVVSLILVVEQKRKITLADETAEMNVCWARFFPHRTL